MATISPVHGGGDLIDRIVTELPDAETLPKVVVNDVDMTSLYRIADGTLSPLTGPMVKEDYDSVLTSKCILRNGEKWAWTIPICLPVTAEEARVSPEGAKVALFSESGNKVFGVMEVSSLFEWDKAAFIKAVYGTERVDHPGARLWMTDDRSTMIGGEISLLPFDDSREFKDRIFSPKKMRAYLEEKAFGASIAFQTRNPLHRAHEYALVYGAETLVKAQGDEKKVGVFLNPLVGQLKGDDVPAKTRMDTYAKLIDEGYLGEGDMDEELWKSKNQNLKEQVTLAGLDMRMFYGGPSEAVMHAIYRQNLGLTHFIIGRKHADAPFDDKSPIWGDFDAQEVFSNLGGQLSIKTVNVGFAAYFEELGRVGLVSDNKGKKSVSISGTKVREMLNRGEKPDDRVMRPTTAGILIEYYQAKNAMKA
ncbi:Sulfate adenylyltransferase ATPS [Gracilaria domingensis]|nr:Sulfate adenylyltransferase ATPS [Gracilaria domingensis]